MVGAQDKESAVTLHQRTERPTATRDLVSGSMRIAGIAAGGAQLYWRCLGYGRADMVSGSRRRDRS